MRDIFKQFCEVYREEENVKQFYLHKALFHKLNIGRTSVSNTVFLVLDFIVHFSYYMFQPRLAAIFRWFINTKISKVVTTYSTDRIFLCL
jgi:hypothetical protein